MVLNDILGRNFVETLATAVRKARSMQGGVAHVADAYGRSGNDTAVVKWVEELMGEPAFTHPAAVGAGEQFTWESPLRCAGRECYRWSSLRVQWWRRSEHSWR
jgi:hypothetical protein